MQKALQILSRQQKTMLWALLAIRRDIRRALQAAVGPDFARLRKLTAYVQRYAEGVHPSNEEKMLMSPVAARQPELARTVARLRRDHSAMKGYGNRLRSTLSDWERGDRTAGPLAAAVADDYANFCLRHTQAERRQLLPAALGVLSPSEWQDAERAFEAAADPLVTAANRHERMSALG